MHPAPHPHSVTDDDRGWLLPTGAATVGGSGYRDPMILRVFSINSVINTWSSFVGGHPGVWIIQTPMEFPYPDPIPDSLRSVITESRKLLDLKDNWDGEGSSGYLESTWQRAVNFLIAQWRALKDEGHAMDVPAILPDSNGSIDLWWDTEDFELLVSIPGSELLAASYYGHKHHEQEIEYPFDSSKADRRRVQWMAKVEGASPTPTTSPHPI